MIHLTYWLTQISFLIMGAGPLRAATYDTFSLTDTSGSFCNVVGGACAGDRDFDAGFFKNPAAFSAGPPNFDFDFDVDFDRSKNREPGLVNTAKYGSRQVMGALAFSTDNYGLGLAYVATDADWQSEFGAVRLISHSGHVPFSYRVSNQWQGGVDLNLNWTELRRVGRAYGTAPGLGLGLGVLYQRGPTTWGARANLPARNVVRDRNADQPEVFTSPASVAMGASHDLRIHDLMGLIELEVIGVTPSGHLFTGNNLAPVKGQHLAWAPRIGVRGSIRERVTGFGGAYVEFKRTEGAADRPHLTLGVSYKVPLNISWWDVAEFMAGVDLAKDYERLFLTFR